MKNIWQKLPAWLKAVLFNIILLLPIVSINQTMILLNLEYFPQFGIALFLVLGTLFSYWFFLKKKYPFQEKDDIQLDLKFNLFKVSNVLSIVGICVFTVSTVAFTKTLFDIESTMQVEFIQAFSEAPPLTGIPLLLALALTAGVVEEITYRAFMQNTTNRKYSRFVSYLIIGVIFSLMHFLPWQLMIPYTIVSMGFSMVADQQKTIGLNIFAHALVDFVLFMLIYFDVPVLSNDFGVLGIVVSLLATLISGYLIIRGEKSVMKYQKFVLES